MAAPGKTLLVEPLTSGVNLSALNLDRLMRATISGIFRRKLELCSLPALCRGMPRYFFNIYDTPPTLDDQGEDLPDDEAAWREATSFAAEQFIRAAGHRRVHPGCRLGASPARLGGHRRLCEYGTGGERACRPEHLSSG
jgi:hypothetical protein